MGVTVRIIQPTSFRPGTDEDVTLSIRNNSRQAFHVRSIEIHPTWIHDTPLFLETDMAIFPDTDRQLQTELSVPPGVGGSQGFHVRLDVAPFDNDVFNYQNFVTPILRLPVQGHETFSCVCFIPDSNVSTEPLFQFFRNWGFTIDAKCTDPETAAERITAIDPELFFSVYDERRNVLDDETELRRLHDCALDSTTWPLLFASHDETDLTESFPFACAFTCNLSASQAIEETAGEIVHRIRVMEEGPLSKRFLERAQRAVRRSLRHAGSELASVGGKTLRRLVESIPIGYAIKKSGVYEEVDQLFENLSGGSMSGISEDDRSKVVDLTHVSDADSYLVEVRPFYRNDPIWLMDRWHESPSIGDLNRGFGSVLREGLLPSSASAFSVYWDSTAENHTVHHSLDDAVTVHTNDPVNFLQMQLPAEGTYIFQHDDIRPKSWLSFEHPRFGAYTRSSDKEIGGNILEIFEKNGEVSKIVVGLPTSNKGLASLCSGLFSDREANSVPGRTWMID